MAKGVTAYFEIDPREIKGNPFHFETPFGPVITIGKGNSFERCNLLETALRDACERLERAGSQRKTSKPYLNPPNSKYHKRQETMGIYVVRTNIKSEDKAERNLRAAGFSTYAPWQRFERLNRRKRVWVQHEMRLAPRYLFLDTGPLSREQTPWGIIRGCEGVEKVLGYQGLPIPLSSVRVRPDEPSDVEALEAIKAAERDFAFDETRAGKLHRREIGKTKKETTKMKFPVGAKVRISDGPFTSFNGEVTNVNGRGHLQVLASIFGRLTPVEMEPGQVEAIASAA